ncbi:hypothetical protein D9756_007870 [Leucocoprinus leucothites]|uniref:Uncharacterized protein n=1 Tax=Leucocoprinus leucothites TaxID=201217 RepID=A0A8H5FYA2_9AGAR|nr:hypothetical protein D9756_007870 [Leucoagaricus leucothites]
MASATSRAVSIAVQPQHSQPANPRRQQRASHSVATSSQPHGGSSQSSPYPDILTSARKFYSRSSARASLARLNLAFTFSGAKGTWRRRRTQNEISIVYSVQKQSALIPSPRALPHWLIRTRSIHSTPSFLPLHAYT